MNLINEIEQERVSCIIDIIALYLFNFRPTATVTWTKTEDPLHIPLHHIIEGSTFSQPTHTDNAATSSDIHNAPTGNTISNIDNAASGDTSSLNNVNSQEGALTKKTAINSDLTGHNHTYHLHLHHVTSTHSGYYECVASNSAGISKPTRIRLDVEGRSALPSFFLFFFLSFSLSFLGNTMFPSLLLHFEGILLSSSTYLFPLWSSTFLVNSSWIWLLLLLYWSYRVA